MKTFCVSVDVMEVHTFKVRANTDDEAYDLVNDAMVRNPPIETKDLIIGEKARGVEHAECRYREVETWVDVGEWK